MYMTGHFLGSSFNARFPADKVGFVSGVLLLVLGCTQLEL